MGKMVHLRIPDLAYSQAKALAEEFGFSNVQEYVRESIRRMNEEYETMVAIRKLKKLKGSVRPIKRMTRKERQAWAEKNIHKDKSDIFRKYGLE